MKETAFSKKNVTQSVTTLCNIIILTDCDLIPSFMSIAEIGASLRFGM